MLDISPILLISSAIIFLIVLKILNSILYQPLFKHMEERTEAIAKDLDLAQNNASDVENMYNEAKQIIAEAKDKASSIREKAYAEAKLQSDSRIANVKSEFESKFKEFEQNLQNDSATLKAELLNNMPVFKEKLLSKISNI